VADVLYNLANLYYQQNKYAKAEPLFQRALQIREQRLGPDHLKVASSLTGLALLYEARLKLAKAKQLYQRALHIREQQLGPDHLEVATTLYNLATLYRSPGKYAEPEPLFQRALQIREQQLGSEHPSTREVREAYESYLKAVRYGYLIGLTLPILISIICLIFWFFHKFDLLSWIALALAIIAARGPFLVGYYILVDRYKKPPSSAT
jgi:tetratricopeptide (TPR) repeat protein